MCMVTILLCSSVLTCRHHWHVHLRGGDGGGGTPLRPHAARLPADPSPARRPRRPAPDRRSAPLTALQAAQVINMSEKIIDVMLPFAARNNLIILTSNLF